MNGTQPLENEGERKATRWGLWLLCLAVPYFALLGSDGPLRSDEVWSLHTAELPLGERLAALSLDVHPPLYFELLAGWVRAFGTGERAMRLLSGLFYAAAVALTYGFARSLEGRPTALLAAVLYAASPLALLGAQFVRMYSLVSLLAVASTWLFWRLFLLRAGRRGEWPLLTVVNALGVFTHVWFFFLLGAQGAVLLRRAPRRAAAFAGLLLASVTPYALLWGPALWRQVGRSSDAAAWLTRPGREDLMQTLLTYGGVLWLLVPMLAVQAWQRRERLRGVWGESTAAGQAAWMLAVLLAVPVAISFVKPVYYSRFTAVGLHLYALSAAAAVSRVGPAWTPIAVLALAGIGAALPVVRPRPCEARWTAEWLQRETRPGDAVVYTNLARPPIDHYWNRVSAKRQVFEVSYPAAVDSHPGYVGALDGPQRGRELEVEADRLVAQLRALREREPSIHVVLLHGFRPATDELLRARLAREFPLRLERCVACGGMPNYFDRISVYGERR